jgi:hypothetical protein
MPPSWASWSGLCSDAAGRSIFLGAKLCTRGARIAPRFLECRG